MPERGCGKSRIRGAIYAEVGLSADGLPIEFFLIEPPIIVDMEALGASAVGVTLLPIDSQDGDRNVLDWVGSDNYPNVADFVEEAKRYGVSRRLSSRIDFSLIGPASRLLLVHQRAHVENWKSYYSAYALKGHSEDAALGSSAASRAMRWVCPKGRHGHEQGVAAGGCCIGTWWRDVDGGVPDPAGQWGEVLRTIGSTYRAWPRPESVIPEYRAAIFAAFPIHRFVVIADPQGKTHEPALEAVSKSALPVLLENE